MTLMCDSSDAVVRNYMLVTVRGQKFKGYLIHKKMCNTQMEELHDQKSGFVGLKSTVL